MKTELDRKWYVIYTKPRQEQTAKENLDRQGYETYLPMLGERKKLRGKWKSAIVPLFPRYLFINLTMHAENIAPLRSTKGVQHLVRFGEGPTQVPTDFVNSLKCAENDRKCDHQTALNIKKSDRLEIIEGPFKGLTGKLYQVISDERIVMLLNVLGRDNKIEFPMDRIAVADDRY